MHVAVDITYFKNDSPFNTGDYIITIFRQLATTHPDFHFLLITDKVKESNPLPENMQWLIIKPAGGSQLLQKWWMDWKLPALLKKNKTGFLFSADGCIPLRGNIISCLLIEHWMLEKYAGVLYKKRWWVLQKHFPRYIKRAGKIITSSNYTRQQLTEKYGVAVEKIAVIPFPVNTIFRPASPEEKEQSRQKFTQGKAYFIYGGDLHPAKNFINLLKAFSFFKKRLHSGMKLLLISFNQRKNPDFATALSTFRFRNDVILSNYSNISQLATMMAGAYTYVCPSGAGENEKMVIAALSCSIPVIGVDHPVIKEIGGDAAVYFNEENHEDLAEKLCLLYKNETLRNRLADQATLQARGLHPEKTAEVLAQILLQMAHAN
jgi:glycosyltransferase involved in cell wall biosynthesis